MNNTLQPAMQFESLAREHEAARLGTWVFLATEVLFIGSLFAGYIIMRVEYPLAFAEASRQTDVLLGSINTGLLLTSSLTMALAVRSGMLGRNRTILVWLIVTVLLGIMFLSLKGLEYYHDYQRHLVPAVNFQFNGPRAAQVELFFFLYFVMTGVHALHLLIAVFVVLVIASMAYRKRFDQEYSTPVEMAGLYWHFVDMVWIFLYPALYLVARS